jgi:hypothetical protein
VSSATLRLSVPGRPVPTVSSGAPVAHSP